MSGLSIASDHVRRAAPDGRPYSRRILPRRLSLFAHHTLSIFFPSTAITSPPSARTYDTGLKRRWRPTSYPNVVFTALFVSYGAVAKTIEIANSLRVRARYAKYTKINIGVVLLYFTVTRSGRAWSHSNYENCLEITAILYCHLMIEF